MNRDMNSHFEGLARETCVKTVAFVGQSFDKRDGATGRDRYLIRPYFHEAAWPTEANLMRLYLEKIVDQW